MANSNLLLSNSNASLASSDGFDAEPGTVKVKKRDQSGTKTAKIGTFAFKATQFFESLGKRSSVKKTSSTSSERTPSVERIRQSSGSQTSLGEMSEKLSPMTPDSHIEESPLESPLEMKKHIKHQGYLDIYSSFNKRKWGKRWCLVHENNFECYRTQTSEVCELEFLLRNCILRRAIEETKSELGLMLLENNREKITIEPINWTELGSWLRILMQETSTPAKPEGLEGYMDETHPYHEAVEITRVPDPAQRQSTLSVKPRGKSTINPAESKSKHASYDNRDSGICSSESTDDRFNSLERNLNSPTVHPCFTDSSLPRVSVSETGAIYTQVKKSNGTGSNSSPATGSRNTGVQSKENFTNSILDFICDSDRSNTVRKGEDDDDKLFFDFTIDAFNEPGFKRESSLVDEIMSELKIQQSNSVETADDTVDNITEADNPHTETNYVTKRKSTEFNPTEKELSPIKSADVTVTGNDSDFLCSSFVENTERVDSNDALSFACDYKPVSEERETEIKLTKEAVSVRRHPSNVSTKSVIETGDTLEELRTRLVQLKKDRISIRDRKQLISSETDSEFLEAEYERLNRECNKVTEEIKSREQPTRAASEIDSNQSNDLTINALGDAVNNVGLTTDNSLSKPDETGRVGSSENRTEDNNLAFSEKNFSVACGESTKFDSDTEESMALENTERNENKVECNGMSSIETTVENKDRESDEAKADLKNTDCNNAKNNECTSQFPPYNTQHYVKSENNNGTVIEVQCNNESKTICDTERVLETSSLSENTQKQHEDVSVTGNTSTDYVIDKLSKDFENRLFLKEN